MCCDSCSVTQRKVWVFGFAVVFLALGTTLLVIWPNMAEKILMNNLVIKEGTENYNNWVEAPIPIFLSFYMFNWTNPEEIRNRKVKPNFVEMGPYVFLEKHLKQNLTFYPNDTVSYFEKRTWFFDEQRSNGKLDDLVTAAHAITATIADEMRHKNKLMKKVINFMLNHEGGMLHATKPVREWIFDGFQDDLIDFLKLFNTSKIDIPYTRFGWLVDRNDSATYDGLFTIHTGAGDLGDLGRLTHWNGKTESGFYEMPCGVVNGTTGDLFPPKIDPNAELTLFVTDTCRFMNLSPNGTVVHRGIEGIRWMGTTETLDSGENYPIQKCFCNPEHEECPKTGVVDCKICRNNAPIYASFPHFYLADQLYVDAISGVHPDPEKHRFTLSIEPRTGIPLLVHARVQINMMITPDADFDIYRDVKKVLMPMFWFEQYAELDEKLAKKTKFGINLGSYGKYMGIAFVSIGGIMIIVGIVLTATKRWKREPRDDEDILTSEPVAAPTT